MLRQLMIYYIKVYSLPRSQALRFHKKSSLHLLIALASASSASVYTKAQTRMALQICRACSACWDAIPIPVNITSRDSRALLRSAERAFCRNAKPASARCRTTGLGCAQQALARQGALYIQRHCLQESFGVPEWYHEALLAEAIASI